MALLWRIVKYIGSGIAMLIFVGLVMLNSCSIFKPSDEKILRKAKKEEAVEVNIHRITCEGRSIRYMVYEHAEEKQDSLAIVCLHGAPGMYSDYRHQFYNPELLKKADFIVIERPGYGQSDYGKAEPSILKQAECVRQIIEHENRDSYVVTGYSYGGPIAGALGAMNIPTVKSLVLVAPVIDPANEKFFWFSRLPQKAAFRWMLPKALYVASIEKETHIEALEEIKPYWSEIRVPTQLIHGKKDKIAPFVNAEFGQQHIATEYFELLPVEKGNHMVIWNENELVSQALKKAIEQAKK